MMPNFRRTVLCSTWRACSDHKSLLSPPLTGEYSGRQLSRILRVTLLLELTSALRQTGTSFTFRRTTAATIVGHLCYALLMRRNRWSDLTQLSCPYFVRARCSHSQREISSTFIVPINSYSLTQPL